MNLPFNPNHYYIEFGIDLENRILFIDEEIDAEVVGHHIRALHIMEKEDIEKEITIYINSNGGCVYSGLSLYDTIVGSHCPIKTICVGSAMSMALILFLAGDERSATENSTFMSHSVGSGTVGKLDVMNTDLKETERLNEVLLSILAERTKNANNFINKFNNLSTKQIDGLKIKYGIRYQAADRLIKNYEKTGKINEKIKAIMDDNSENKLAQIIRIIPPNGSTRMLEESTEKTSLLNKYMSLINENY
jgi:ATP-dependent Clp protease protease subunit